MCAEEDGMAAFAALFTEYLSYTEIRNDVVAVADFDIGDSDLLERAIKLFWEVTQPSLFSFSDKRYESKDVPPFPIELEHALLEKLAEFERRSRVDYLPDEDPFTRFPERMVYIHVAAARALRLKWTQGYTDETRQSLESAFMVAKQLDPEPPSVYGDEAPPQISSAWAATGLALKDVGCQRNWTLLRPRKPKRLGVVEAPSEG